MDEKCVENLALALVREYLSRKGYKQTLNCFDKESMKKDESIQNRRTLAETLHIIHLVKKNKESLMYRCFLEMIVQELLDQAISKKDKHDTEKHWKKLKMSPDNSDYNNNVTETSSRSLKSNSDKSYEKEDKTVPMTTIDTVTISPEKSLFYGKKESVNSPTKIPRPRSPKSLVTSQSSGIAQESRTSEKSKIPVLFGSVCSTRSDIHRKSHSLVDDRRGDESKLHEHRRESFIEKVRRQKEHNSSPQQLNQSYDSNKQRSQSIDSCKQSNQSVESCKKLNQSTESYQQSNQSHDRSNKNMNTMILEDYNFTEITKDLSPQKNSKISQSSNLYFRSEPITFEISSAIKTLLFGSSTVFFNVEWRTQGFHFSKHPLVRYGLVQDKGGPCGILAAVQAYILKNMLFSGGHTLSSIPQPDEKSQNELLVTSMTEILWSIPSDNTVIVPLMTPSIKFTDVARWKPDNFTEKLQLFYFSDMGRLIKFLTKNLSLFKKPNGCILFLYAVILTAGVQNIRNSMDEANGTLIGRHGYCTQEMVNLLLTGHAVSNVFDGKMEIGETTLYGLKSRSKIGFLSLFEHYGSCQVGEYYKTPLHPIWVVCSESHFSVLFSLVNIPNRHGETFDLYYYDELANQDEEIRLTVTSMIGNKTKIFSPRLDLEPPLENCIRTKWKNVQISWNGTDPIL